MNTFRAFKVFENNGRLEGRVVDTSLDELSAGDVVIKAAYSSVNYKDAMAATIPKRILRRVPMIPGIDVSGTVESSADVRFRQGDRVLITGYDLGVSHDGGYSQYVRVPADWIVRVPAGLDLLDVMAIGTAGFTAALSVIELERNGLTPAAGPVIVTGATGGVGTMGVQCLAARGYAITALTGKDAEHDYLRSLGASEILPRSAVPSTSLRAGQPATGPIGKATWAGAIDPVGGDTLAWLIRTMAYRGAIAASGLTGGTDVHTNVIPFILRSVKLLGIDSVMCPMDLRLEVWRRLATDLKPARLKESITEIGLSGLPQAFETLLKGAARGRFVVTL